MGPITAMLYKHMTAVVLVAFIGTMMGPLPMAQADDFRLPVPGVMAHLSPPLDPPILKGIKVHPNEPFQFDFILNKGDSELSNDQLKNESIKLIKYFLTSLTISEKDLWVNLSPYEKNRIIPNTFGLTEMGRDLLAEDYMLKQITASLIYPEGKVGKEFWKKVYAKAEKEYGTTNIPVNTFNKVWIVPEKAVVYENAEAGTAYVVQSKLKVMLEQDYLSLTKHEGIGDAVPSQGEKTNQIGSQVVREIVIPELEKEVNEGKNFAPLRQVYNSLILATWYKKKIKDSILAQVYENKDKIAGVKTSDPQEKEKIYRRYLQAFKKGVFNYIKEDIDPATQEPIPRKYFSGGIEFTLRLGNGEHHTNLNTAPAMVVVNDQTASPAMISSIKRGLKKAGLILILASLSIWNSPAGDLSQQHYGNSGITQANHDITMKMQQNKTTRNIVIMGQIHSDGVSASRINPMVSNLAQIIADLEYSFPGDSDTDRRLYNEYVKGLLKEKRKAIESLQEDLAAIKTNVLDNQVKTIAVEYSPEEMGVVNAEYKTMIYRLKEAMARKGVGPERMNAVFLYILGPAFYLSFQKDFDATLDKNDPGFFNSHGLKIKGVDDLSAKGRMGKTMEKISQKLDGLGKIVSKNLANKVWAQTDVMLFDFSIDHPLEIAHLSMLLKDNRALKGWVPAFLRLYKQLKQETDARSIHMAHELAGIRGNVLIIAGQMHYRVLNKEASKGNTNRVIGRPKENWEKKVEAIIKDMSFNKSGNRFFAQAPKTGADINLAAAVGGKVAHSGVNRFDAAQGTKGGIDLTPANMNLQTQNGGQGIKFHLDSAMLQQLQNASGFVPVIINIQPMTDFRGFFGFNQSETNYSLAKA